MKFLLSFLLFSTSNQLLVYNTLNQHYYIIDTTSQPINILVLEEKMVMPLSCISEGSYNLSLVDFKNNRACLVQSLNENFNLRITDYADLNNHYSEEELLSMKDASIPTLAQAALNITHSYSYSQLIEMYHFLKKNEFQNEIHHITYLKIKDEYLPISY